VDKNPGFGTGFLYLAKALLDVDDLTAAEQAAKKGLGSKPDAGMVPLRPLVLADVYSRLGRQAEARARSRQASALNIPAIAPGGRDPPVLAGGCQRGRVPVGRRGVSSKAPPAPQAAGIWCWSPSIRSAPIAWGIYGNATVATPNMGSAGPRRRGGPARVGAVPLTRPSHVSLLSGLYPPTHGIRDNVSPPLRPGRAAARRDPEATRVPNRRLRFLDRALETIRTRPRDSTPTPDQFEIGDDDARFLNTIQKRGDTTVAEAAAWLRQPGSERRFAWVHLYDPHDPYEPPEPYATRYAGRLYDGEVAWSDDLVGRLDAVLAETGRRDDTLVVVTADHGEGLDEHGEAVHGFFLYETTSPCPADLPWPRG
jgi:hypothetical protein